MPLIELQFVSSYRSLRTSLVLRIEGAGRSRQIARSCSPVTAMSRVHAGGCVKNWRMVPAIRKG
jgi:hypothetical protein